MILFYNGTTILYWVIVGISSGYFVELLNALSSRKNTITNVTLGTCIGFATIWLTYLSLGTMPPAYSNLAESIILLAICISFHVATRLIVAKY